MSWETWSLFAAATLVLCLTPGPAVLFVLSQALSRGAARAFWSVLGILIANLLYFILSATSLGAVLSASYSVFFLVKWVGAAYLLWLGATTFFGRSPVLRVMPAADRRCGALRMVASAFVVQAANPKALLFFTAFLPQFIDPGRPVLPQFAVMTVTGEVLEFAVLTSYAALAAQAAVVAALPRFGRIANRVSGSLLVGAGAGLAALRRQ